LKANETIRGEALTGCDSSSNPASIAPRMPNPRTDLRMSHHFLPSQHSGSKEVW
jgi:hypothetical protein